MFKSSLVGKTGPLTACNGQHSSATRLSDGANIWPNSPLLPLGAEGAEGAERSSALRFDPPPGFSRVCTQIEIK